MNLIKQKQFEILVGEKFHLILMGELRPEPTNMPITKVVGFLVGLGQYSQIFIISHSAFEKGDEKMDANKNFAPKLDKKLVAYVVCAGILALVVLVLIGAGLRGAGYNAGLAAAPVKTVEMVRTQIVEVPGTVQTMEVQVPAAQEAEVAKPAEVVLPGVVLAEVSPSVAVTDTKPKEAPLDVEALYAIELSKLASEPMYHRGEDPSKGFTETLTADSYRLYFAGHLTLAVDGQTVAVPWPGHAAENVVLFYNSSNAEVEVQLSGYPATGFSDWLYKAGTVPEAFNLAASSIGNPTHCGLTAGCPEAHVWEIAWDGKALKVLSHNLLDEPVNLALAAENAPVIAWEKVSPAEGLHELPKALSQPESVIVVSDPKVPIELGVTFGKDHGLVLPSGAKIVSPEGKEYLLETAGVVVLSNNVGDTVVFTIWLPSAAEVVHYEFKIGFDAEPVGAFLVRAVAEQPKAFAMDASPATLPELLILDYGTGGTESK